MIQFGSRSLIILIIGFVISPKTQALCTDPPFQCFQNCIEGKGLPLNSIVTQDSDSTLYATVNHQWNQRLQQIEPLAYFLPTSTQDVKKCVKCASKFNINVIPKSGGHSFEAYSFGNNGTIIIDFRGMSQIEVDVVEKTATIETGALVGPVYVNLWRNGSFGLPMAGCLGLGIGGLALGGGTDFFTPAYGLLSDNLLEVRMVAADGDAYTATETMHSNLFWALRGVGSGYIGIVTSLKFKLFDATNMKVTLLTNWYNINQGAEVFEAWQNWITWTNSNEPTAMNVLTFGPIKNTTRHIGLRARSYHFQTAKYPENNTTFISKWIETYPTPVNATTTLFPNYMDFVLKTHVVSTVANKTLPLTEADLLNLPNDLIFPKYLYRKAFYVNKLFNSSQLVKVGDILSQMPENGFVLVSVWYEGGSPSKILPNATSYVHRDALYTMYAEYSGPNTPGLIAEGQAWIAQFINATKFMDDGQTYQNYVDGERLDYLNGYYGSNLNKLVKIKRRWDPENYFQNPQSLPIHL